MFLPIRCISFLHYIIFFGYPMVNFKTIKYSHTVERRCFLVNFSDKLKMLRTGQKMTQQQLATRLGVAKSVVSYYESGDRFPSYDVLIKIAHIFHTTTDYLLDVERQRVIDVSDLSEEHIAVVTTVADALRSKK